MIGHQNVGMHEHATVARSLRQPVQIKPPVRVFEEDRGRKKGARKKEPESF
jgi:hypothetical protein